MTGGAKRSPPPAPTPWLRRNARPLLLVLLLAVIELTYVAIISAGTFTTWPTWNNNYDLLAEGFRSGHLYLSMPPPRTDYSGTGTRPLGDPSAPGTGGRGPSPPFARFVQLWVSIILPTTPPQINSQSRR